MRKLHFQEKDIFKGNLILVNRKTPIADGLGHKVNLLSVNPKYPGICIEKSAAVMLSGLISDIGGEDKIVPVSGFRKRAEQEQIYADSLRENGEEFTRCYVAYPGHSEHQTGFAIDLAKDGEDIDFIRPEFPFEGIYNEFREKASRYGFILRYQQEKEDITGISYEPWHFRYVGYPHSRIVKDWNFSLEEYLEELKTFTYHGKHMVVKEKGHEIEIFYINREEFDSPEIQIPSDRLCQVSGNNMDGVIITLWRNHG